MAVDWFSSLRDRLAAPVLLAPMTGVSSPALMAAVTGEHLAASFPTHMASTPAELAEVLHDLQARPDAGPVLPNLVVHRTNPRRDADLDVVRAAQVPAVICSVGSPAAVIAPLHAAGIAVLADVASVAHARRALEVGADGLVLLAAGGGGQTGWANPFAFIEEVRSFFDGPCVLAGGVTSGRGVAAAQVAGYDLAYVGTGFLASPEGAAGAPWREAVVASSMDDIELTSAVTGISASMIRDRTADSTLVEGPYDASRITESMQPGARGGTARWSAGHGVGQVRSSEPAAAVAQRLIEEYRAATRSGFRDR